jgi:hypothetical protein
MGRSVDFIYGEERILSLLHFQVSTADTKAWVVERINMY